MKRVLVVVDYQKDFVDGALGFEKAKEIEEGIEKMVNILNSNENYGPIEEYKWQYISKKLNDILKG